MDAGSAQPSLLDNIRGRSLAAAWLMLGIATLGASTLFAILVAFSRSPATAHLLPGSNFFHLALVLHVTLGPLLCFLAFAMTMWNLATPQAATKRSGLAWNGVGWLGFTLSALGAAVLVLVPIGGAPHSMEEVVLSNYIAVLQTPMFLTGLALFGGGFALSLIPVLRQLRPNMLALPERTLGWGLLAGALAGGVALVSLGWSAAGLPENLPPTSYFEMLFWGPGHILQSMHVLMMMVVWLVLADAADIPLRSTANMRRLLFLLAFLPVLAAPLVHLAFSPESAEFRSTFTGLMRWAIWPGITLLAADILYSLFLAKQIKGVRWSPATWALLFSIALLVIGLVIGASIQENNAVVPAHYHATTGAITMAYLGMALVLLSRLAHAATSTGSGQASVARWPVLAYGTGTLFMAAALGWAGLAGMTRKLPGSEKVLEGYSPHLTVIAIGGTLVIIGGIGFVVIMLRGWLRASTLPKWKTAIPLLGTALMMAVGIVYTLLPAQSIQTPVPAIADPHADPEQHMRQRQTSEIDVRFQQAVVMLHAKRYEEAITALRRLLVLAPRLPEAHINMGFALLGLKQYGEARKAFETALEIRPTQANAYYGLALALKGMNDPEGAVGAMRSYIHLSTPDDPYLNNARATLSEWEKARGRKPGKDIPSIKTDQPKEPQSEVK
jgi:cytochrome c oxidase subunit 1